MTYDECRRQYPEFHYERAQADETADRINLTYTFIIPGLDTFRPTWSIPKSPRFPGRALDDLVNTGYIQKQPRWRANGAKSSNQYVFRI